VLVSAGLSWQGMTPKGARLAPTLYKGGQNEGKYGQVVRSCFPSHPR